MKNFLRRAGWAFLAILFVVTGLGVGVYAFWVSTHPPKDEPHTAQTETLAGTQLPGFDPVNKVGNLQKIDQQTGKGKEAKANSTVTVEYTGALASTGLIFESSKDSGRPATLSLGKVIKGWQEGIPGMKEGGTRRLLIPAALAYGEQSNGLIPPNSDLVFDVTLININ